MEGSDETTAGATETTETTETAELNGSNDSFNNQVEKILNEQNNNSEVVNAPFGINKRTGEPKKRHYPEGVTRGGNKKKKKKTIRKAFNAKDEKLNVTKPKTENSSQQDYKSYKENYDKSLDPDAREDKGEDSLLDDPANISATVDPHRPKPRFGNSLVVITQFVLPVLCTLSTRLISRNKKKPDSKDFRMDEFEKEMLKELADDGAGEEMLAGANKSMVYIIVALALGANKTMDYWDKDDSESKDKAYEEMREKFEALEKSYKELSKKVNPAGEAIPI